MKRKILICLLVLGLGVSSATAQLGSGVVFDPTNFHNALLRYYQLQQHLIQLQKSYTQITKPSGHLLCEWFQFVKKHARSIPRHIFPMAQRDLAQHLWEHGFVD